MTAPRDLVSKAMMNGQLPDDAFTERTWNEYAQKDPTKAAAELQCLPVGRYRNLVTAARLDPGMPAPRPGQSVAAARTTSGRKVAASSTRLTSVTVTASGADPSLAADLPWQVRGAYARAATLAAAQAVYQRFAGPDGDLEAEIAALRGGPGLDGQIAADARDVEQDQARAAMEAPTTEDDWMAANDFRAASGLRRLDGK